MNTQVAKDQFAFTLGNVSYIDTSYEETPAQPVRNEKRGIARWYAGMVAAFKEWGARQAVLREMEMLTDRELADIGISRGDLPRVFEPAFAADHARGQGYVGY